VGFPGWIRRSPVLGTLDSAVFSTVFATGFALSRWLVVLGMLILILILVLMAPLASALQQSFQKAHELARAGSYGDALAAVEHGLALTSSRQDLKRDQTFILLLVSRASFLVTLGRPQDAHDAFLTVSRSQHRIHTEPS
jgi:hypothetical protein